jgi:hypothetical protein
MEDGRGDRKGNRGAAGFPGGVAELNALEEEFRLLGIVGPG